MTADTRDVIVIGAGIVGCLGSRLILTVSSVCLKGAAMVRSILL